MRYAIRGLAVALGFFLLVPRVGQAQVGNNLGADPFSLYYGFYLPNQAYQASQPRPEDTINANASSRQYDALRARGETFEPYSPFREGEDEFGRRGGRPNVAHFGNMRGAGVTGYHNRTDRYFPTMRVGRGPNKNIAVLRSARGSGGMPSMPSMPGPR